ncbi:hypothetical protein [Pontibacter ruber]|uniref:DUF4239 domain-containing protein n=1 Tax=Pontibacter ruber TaxID=1343895 RepID=A0ABW5CVT5_9BACT|nr:hypothetical protein [Pontibacter ruber]
MDIASLVTSIPGWALFSLTVILGVLAAEVGSWLARLKKKKGSETPDSVISTEVGAMLALLAFILGFTFSITSSRFADRKELVIRQANAIGTSYLRTSFIPEPQKQEVRKLYREYVSLLLQLTKPSDADKVLHRLGTIHLLLWNQVTSLAQVQIDPQIRALVISSVNDVIDVSGERETVALVFQIPGVLWASLYLLFTLSMFAIGYQAGTTKIRGSFDIPLLAAAFAMVIVMIANMDTTGYSLFRVSQLPLENLYEMMQEDIP